VIFPVTGATKEQATAILNVFAGQFSEQFSVSDTDLSISWAFSTGKLPYMIADGTQKLISALLLLPNGVMAKSLEIEGLVTASNNIGVAETTDESVRLSMMPRGAAAHFVWQVETQISALAAMLGAEAKFVSRSPAWPFNPQSELLKTAMEVYPRIFGGLGATPTAVHGGLECGIFLEKFKPRALDIISFGPNAYDYHTPDERVSISSVERVWEFLVALLEVL
jgi:dipeptidase D